jgi:hypothetical protein
VLNTPQRAGNCFYGPYFLRTKQPFFRLRLCVDVLNNSRTKQPFYFFTELLPSLVWPFFYRFFHRALAC